MPHKRKMSFKDVKEFLNYYKALKEYNLNITVYDPWANSAIVEHEYGIKVINDLSTLTASMLALPLWHTKSLKALTSLAC